MKSQNYFYLGIYISSLLSIAIAIWSTYLIRFFDMLPGSEKPRTYITVFGGLIIILYLLKLLKDAAFKEAQVELTSKSTPEVYFV